MDERIKRIVAAIIDFYIAVFISSAFILIITLGKMTLTPFSLTAYLTIFLLFMLFKDIVFKNTSIGIWRKVIPGDRLCEIWLGFWAFKGEFLSWLTGNESD